MRDPAEWAAIDLGEDVRLLLGWREGRRDLQALPVDVTSEIGAELLAACKSALERLEDMDRRVFSGVPALDPGQFLSLVLESDEEDEDENTDEPGTLLLQE